MKPRILAAVGLGLGLTAGGATAVVAGVPGLAGAAAPAATPSATGDDGSTTTTADDGTATTTDEGTATTDSTTDESTSGTTESTDTDGPKRLEPGEFLQETLQPLVDAGTLTQEQADAVIAAIQEARPPFGEGGPGGWGHGGGHHGKLAVGLDTAATALGISAEDLRAALEDGKSIADVAAEQGVDVQTVIDAIVAEASAHLDEAVAAGDLTAEEAAERKTELTERITEIVNRAGGLRPGRLPEPPGDVPAPDAPAPTTPESSTGD